MDTQEQFINIPGYDGDYVLSNYGYVISYKNNKEKILKYIIDRLGYAQVSLSKSVNGKRQIYKKAAHKLIQKYFLNTVDCHINHIDANKLNNHIDNLENCTPKENSLHASKMGKLKNRNVKKVPVIIYDEVVDIYYECESKLEAARVLNVSASTINLACDGKQKTVKDLKVYKK